MNNFRLKEKCCKNNNNNNNTSNKNSSNNNILIYKKNKTTTRSTITIKEKERTMILTMEEHKIVKVIDNLMIFLAEIKNP